MFGSARLGGLGRTDRKNTYIFSGLLVCASCGYRIVIVGGTGKDARYGCPNHRYKGVCTNAVNIYYQRLERQLIGAIVSGMLGRNMLEHAVEQFHKQLRQDAERLIESRKKTRSEAPRLKAELRKLDIEAKNLGSAIATYGIHRSPTLLSQLELVENRMEAITVSFESRTGICPYAPLRRFGSMLSKRLRALNLFCYKVPRRPKWPCELVCDR